MSLEVIQLRSFRNYHSLQQPIGPGITVFTGQNGMGKTTILEAVSILGSGRSFRNARNVDFIKKGDEMGLIRGRVQSAGLIYDLEVRIYPQSKKVFVDNKLAKSSRVIHDILPTIAFSPADHRIIEGDSADRKQFLNRAAANVDWEYNEDLNHYNKALLQRNRILKDVSDYNLTTRRFEDLIAPWDEQLLHYGSRLIARRNYYLTELRPWVLEEYQRIASKPDQFDLIYQPLNDEAGFPCDLEGEIKEIFAQRVRDSLRRDIASGSTQVGPHKDEILLILNANKVKFYGSQGEKRTCALALRLGELALFRHKVGKMPVLLFDDVSSELDSARRRSLVELLKKENTQVLITATELPSTLMGDVGRNFDHIDLHTLGERQ